MSAPPFPIEGEKRQLNGGLYMYSKDIDPRDGDSYMPSLVTLWNSSEDTQYRVTFTLSEPNVTRLGDTKNEQEGVYQSLLYPGEAKELFEGSFASYKLSMQFGTPDKEWLDKQAAKESKEVHVEIDAVKALVKMFPSPDGKYTADYIATLCEAYQIPFVDLTFPPKPVPTLAREFENSELSKAIYPFKRPHSYAEGAPGLWTDSNDGEAPISPMDIGQGNLGSCYLLAGIAGCSEDPSRIERMFACPRNPSLGIYRVIMCKNAWRHVMTVDDLIATRNGKPVFCSNKTDLAELWPALMEKLYAKMYGSYAAIAGGSPPHAIADLIGTPFVRLRDHPGWEEPGKESLFTFMEEADRRGALISLATPGVDTSDYAGGGSANEKEMSKRYEDVGLVSGHAFTALEVRRYRNHKLLRIRNPWSGSREWSGKWGDDDTASWTEDAKQALGYQKRDDGTFWMDWDDVWDWFDGGAVNYTLKGWSCVRIAGNFDAGVSDVVMRVTNTSGRPVKLFMGMHQKDNRGVKPQDVKKYVAVLTAITRQKPDSTRAEVLDQSGDAFMSARDVFMETELPPCDPSNPYYALPMCYSEVDRSFVCTMWFSSHEGVSIEFMGFKDSFKKRLMHPANFVPSQCSMKVAADIQVETPEMNGLWVNQETHMVDWTLRPAQPATPDELETVTNVEVALQARERAVAAASGEPIEKVCDVKSRLPYGTPAPSSAAAANQSVLVNNNHHHDLGASQASADFQPTPSMLPSASMIAGGDNNGLNPSESEAYRQNLLGFGPSHPANPPPKVHASAAKATPAANPNKPQHIDPFAGGSIVPQQQQQQQSNNPNNTRFQRPGAAADNAPSGLLQLPTLNTTGPAPVQQQRPPPALVANKPLTLSITAVAGSNLCVRDVNGKADPYLTLAVLNGNGIPRKEIPPQSTPYEDSTLEPVWGHTMTFRNINPSDKFEVSCWDKDFIGRDEFMGTFSFTVSSLGLGPERKSKKIDVNLTGEAPSPLPFLPSIPQLPTYGEITGSITLVVKIV